MITASRNGAHPEESQELIDFLMQSKVMAAYCKAQVAIPTLNGLANDDPALSGVQSYINDGKIVGFTDHQFIAAIPLAPLLQTFLLSGNEDRFLADLDSDWDKVAKRRTWGIGATGCHDHHQRTRQPGAPPADDRGRLDVERQAGQAVGHPDATHLRRDGAAGPRAVLRLPHRPGPAGRLLQLHRLAGLRPLEPRRAAQLHRAVHRPADPARLLVHLPDRRECRRSWSTSSRWPSRWASTAGSSGRTPCAGSTSSPTCWRSSSSGYIFNYLFSNSLPALGQKLGLDFLSTSLLTRGEDGLDRHRDPRRLAVRGLQHHHLHRRPADRADRGLRGRVHRRRRPPGSSSAASPSR